MRSIETRTAIALFTGLIVSALIVLPTTDASAAPFRTASNPNPHVSSYVGTAGTEVLNVNSDNCASCHRAHTAKNEMLLTTSGSQSDLCFTCHDGTGATTDVKSEFVSGPQNDPATASYYRHDATAVTNHTLAVDNEFGGVLNRHSECTDCHNPHAAANTDATVPAAGVAWPTSGRLAAISGVTVDNSTTPATYTFASGVGTTLTFEYQLCLKCHSNFTVLPANTSGKPSRDLLDAGAEFDPANAAYHPVEAAGKNQTTAMANSLSGSSPYKLWSFGTTATVRCTSCHADALFGAGSPTPNAVLPPHTSLYRGILLQNYEDRTLLTATAPYDSSNFALCFLCHTDSPFKNETAGNSATNFLQGTNDLHYLHTSNINGIGDPAMGSTIDDMSAGSGNALCAECHFRPHSTKFPGNNQASNSRLVAFGPNVTGNDTAAPTWTVDTQAGTVTCDLTCHGHQHSAANGDSYTWVGQ